jgi:sulfate/thiosulfate transport system permease protein
VRRRSPLPGFGLSLGFSLSYLGLLVLIPLATLFLRSAGLTWAQFWDVAGSPRALAAYRLTFGAAALATLLNAIFGSIVAWVLVRYPFPGRALLDAIVDLPFALPTAVGGIALTAVYSTNGWIGRLIEPLGLKVAYSPLGVVVR